MHEIPRYQVNLEDYIKQKLTLITVCIWEIGSL